MLVLNALEHVDIERRPVFILHDLDDRVFDSHHASASSTSSGRSSASMRAMRSAGGEGTAGF